MITPNQIRERKISVAQNDGYDRDEVNNLLLEIIESYEAVYNENKELYRKMEVLANRIEEYRADEDSIKSALITAQKMASKLTNEAKEKAEETLANSAQSAQQTVVDAKEKADKIIGEAREYVATLTKEKAEAADEIINDAQKKANEAINGANIVASNALANAKKLAGEIVSKAKAEKEYHSEIVTKLKSESKDFRSTLVTLYEAQLDKIKDLAGIGTDVEIENDSIEELEKELNELLEGIDDIDAVEADNEASEEVSEEIAEPVEAEEAPAEEIVEEINEEPAEEEQDDEPQDEVDEIIDELGSLDELEFESIEEEELPPTEEEVQDALNSFTADEITPIDDSVKTIPVIDDEPEFESSALPFESFFNVNKAHENIDETISLIPPDDDEDDDNTKFKGFFKKKK